MQNTVALRDRFGHEPAYLTLVQPLPFLDLTYGIANKVPFALSKDTRARHAPTSMQTA